MGTTRFKGENASERLDFSGISDSDMIQLRHKPGTEEDADKGISKANLCSCPFGVSDTSASTTVKSAVLTDSNPDFNLVSGREVVVCFTTANTASGPSLNFAGSGSIPIYYPDGSAVGSWPADTWMHLKYFSVTIGNTSIQRWILLSPLPVDTVALNNMQSVTSNAVFLASSPNYANKQLIFDGLTRYENSGYVAPDNGFLIASGWGTGQQNNYIIFTINEVTVQNQGNADESVSAVMPVRKGDVVRINICLATNNNGCYFVPCN